MNQLNNKAAKVAAAPASPMPRRPLTEKQIAVLPLLPIFDACKSRNLPTDAESKEARLYACNSYLNNFDIAGFDWVEESFKELLTRPAAVITVLADAISRGAISWA